MRVEKQFSVFMVNKPGVLAQVLNEFAKDKINIQALTMMDSAEHGVMRVVGRDQAKIRTLLSRLNMPFSETDVLCITLSNKSGALAEVTQKLSESHINITYAYCTAGARGGKTTGVLKVADVKKAFKVLQGGNAKKDRSNKSVRRSPASKQ